jgi:hypothetical protein
MSFHACIVIESCAAQAARGVPTVGRGL